MDKKDKNHINKLLKTYKLKQTPDFINELGYKFWKISEFDKFLIKRGLKGKIGVFLLIQKEDPSLVIIDDKNVIYQSSSKESIGSYIDMLSKVY